MTALRPSRACSPLLPSTPDDIEQTRWWLALRAFADHARADATQGQDGRSSELVARADDTDRRVVTRFLAAGVVDAVADDGEAAVECLLACVNGLRHRLVSGADPLASDFARQALIVAITSLRRPRMADSRG